MKSKPLITERKGSYYLRKSFDGKQREVALGTNKKTAESRAIRFMATAEKSGYETAKAELDGIPVIKAGGNPTFEEMETLYREFCKQSANPPRDHVITKNLQRLKFIMTKCGFKSIGSIDQNKIASIWFKDIKSPTPSDKRTFASAISCASGVFKLAAIKYYQSRKMEIENPFKGLELARSKVSKYSPISKEVRESIWNDCETELNHYDAMVVLMALGIGMRRSEICAAIPNWFSVQSEKVLVTIKEEKHFQPKEEESGIVPIPISLYEKLLNLRGDSKSFYFVPSSTPNENANRLNKRYDKINTWLKSKGMNERKPIHSLRKECGSLIAQQSNSLEASKVLRNTVQVASIHYLGVSDVKTVEMEKSFTNEKTPEEILAEKFGLSLDELEKRLKK